MSLETPPVSVETGGPIPTRWDALAAILVLGLVAFLAYASHQLLEPLAALQGSEISLAPEHLPEYAARTTLRMLAALALSLLFTFTYATAAAKSRRAALVLIPILDVLQSVPILGFISITIVFFMSLAPGKVLGAEFASIFAIFTSQAWNMAFSFYQSLRTVPEELTEAARCFQLSPWMRFWRLEAPFAMPALVWNMMMSMSGGWFFVVASEAISVGNTTVMLPGIGSYIATAIAERDTAAIGWAIGTMLVVILLYDQLLFRPLVAWADRFRFEQEATVAAPRSLVLDVLHRSHLVAWLVAPFAALWRRTYRMRSPLPGLGLLRFGLPGRWLDGAWLAIIIGLAALALWRVWTFVIAELTAGEVVTVFGLGAITMVRVVVLIALASLVWVPIGVAVGMRPVLARWVQPVAQFMAAFPANVLFPLVVSWIVLFRLDADIWLSPLMILGTQWYILFNVVAGTTTFPNDLQEAARNLRIGGWLWWRRVMLPGIFPYYVTGAITAAGGAWNASIVAEKVSWGDTTLTAAGLGAYIADATAAGDYPRILLGIAVMCLFVILFNRLLWRPLYGFAERRLRLS